MDRHANNNSKRFEVIIVGAGMIGVGLLYELAKRGAKVLMLEASTAGAGASGGNLGLILPEPVEKGPHAEVVAEGLGRISCLEHELGFDLEYEECGILYLARNEKEMAEGEQMVKGFKELGYPFEMISGNRLPELEPNLNSDGLPGAVYYPEQARLNPFRFVYAYLEKARELGAQARFGEEVLEFIQTGSTVNGVVTNQGDYFSDTVVLTTGAWTRPLVQKLGISIPQFYIHGEAMVTERLPGFLRNVVSLVHCDRIDMEKEAAKSAMAGHWAGDWTGSQAVEFAVSQMKDGEIVIGEVSYATPVFNKQTTHDSISLMARDVINYFPGLSSAHIIRSWVSPIPFTPDHLPFIGKLPGIEGVAVCSGFASAIIVTPVISAMVADWLLNKPVPMDLSAYDPARFMAKETLTKPEGDHNEL